MKVLLVAALAVLISTAAQACTLSESDFQALAASPSQLTPSGFSALTPVYQNSVCNTRAFLKEVDDQKGVITDIKPYSTKYLTPAEKQRIAEASDDLVVKLLAAKKH